MSQAQYDFDYAGTTKLCSEADADSKTGAGQHPEVGMSFCAILNGTLTGQTHIGLIGTGDTANLKRNANGDEVAYSFVDKVTLDDASGYYAYTLADGAIVAFKPGAKECELPIGTQMTDTILAGDLNDCLGFIDVNGVTLPNKEVTCTTDTTSQKVQEPCAVKNDANHMTDVFPIVFHDATVEPASNAAKYVLTSAK